MTSTPSLPGPKSSSASGPNLPSAYESIYASLLPETYSRSTLSTLPGAASSTSTSTPATSSFSTTLPTSSEQQQQQQQQQQQRPRLTHAGSFQARDASEPELQRFKESGVLEDMKAHARLSIALAQQNQSSRPSQHPSLLTSTLASSSSSRTTAASTTGLSSTPATTATTSIRRGPQNLLQKAINSLILGHLRDQGYSYTAQVFIPESRTHPAGLNALTAEDVLQTLQIKPATTILASTSSALTASRSTGTSSSSDATASDISSPSAIEHESYIPPPVHAFVRDELLRVMTAAENEPPQLPTYAQNGPTSSSTSSSSSSSSASSKLQSAGTQAAAVDAPAPARKSLLTILCEAFAHDRPGVRRGEASTSTADLELVVPRDSLQRRLEALDREAAARIKEASGVPMADLEARMLQFQRECNERANQEVASRVARFEQTEIERMRREERNKYRKELETARAELDKKLETALAQCRKSEMELSERQRENETALEMMRYKLRQESLDEMERIRTRERDTRRALETEQRNLTQLRGKLEQELADTRDRSLVLEQQERRIKLTVNEEVEKLVASLRSQLNTAESKCERMEREAKEARVLADDATRDRAIAEAEAKRVCMGYW